MKMEERDRFRSLYHTALAAKTKKERKPLFKECIDYGKNLLDICDGDDYGVGYYVMSIYAIRGEKKDLVAAESYQKEETEYSSNIL